jgi:hypothetical protein
VDARGGVGEKPRPPLNKNVIDLEELPGQDAEELLPTRGGGRARRHGFPETGIGAEHGRAPPIGGVGANMGGRELARVESGEELL